MINNIVLYLEMIFYDDNMFVIDPMVVHKLLMFSVMNYCALMNLNIENEVNLSREKDNDFFLNIKNILHKTLIEYHF